MTNQQTYDIIRMHDQGSRRWRCKAMTGSLQIKKNKYYVVVRREDAQGVSHQQWIATGLPSSASKREAKQCLRKILDQLETMPAVYTEKVYFADWIEKFLRHKAVEVDAVTMQGYRGYADTHIIPYYRQKKTVLQTMMQRDVQDYYDDKAASGLSSSTVRKHRAVIRGALNYACEQHMIDVNPALTAKVPKVYKAPVGKAYTAEQTKVLLDTIRGDELFPVVFLAVNLGLRRSEVLGLQWKHINFNDHTLLVEHVVTGVNQTVEKDRTKTQSSRRTLPLATNVEVFLRELRLKQFHDEQRLGKEYEQSPYVCRHSNGKPMRPDFVTYRFRLLLEKNQLPMIRFHDLRHTTASLLLRNGIGLKDIQEFLGHSKLSVTADLYSHLEFDSKIKAVGVMNTILDDSQSSNKSSNKNALEAQRLQA